MVQALDPYRYGVEACRPILEVIVDFCTISSRLCMPAAADVHR